MPETLRDKIRQWYILGIAICLIVGGAILASLDSQQANALKAASAAQTQVRVAASDPAGSRRRGSRGCRLADVSHHGRFERCSG